MRRRSAAVARERPAPRLVGEKKHSRREDGRERPRDPPSRRVPPGREVREPSDRNRRRCLVPLEAEEARADEDRRHRQWRGERKRGPRDEDGAGRPECPEADGEGAVLVGQDLGRGDDTQERWQKRVRPPHSRPLFHESSGFHVTCSAVRAAVLAERAHERRGLGERVPSRASDAREHPRGFDRVPARDFARRGGLHDHRSECVRDDVVEFRGDALAFRRHRALPRERHVEPRTFCLGARPLLTLERPSKSEAETPWPERQGEAEEGTPARTPSHAGLPGGGGPLDPARAQQHRLAAADDRLGRHWPPAVARGRAGALARRGCSGSGLTKRARRG
jgi:hypothetical protein